MIAPGLDGLGDGILIVRVHDDGIEEFLKDALLFFVLSVLAHTPPY